jgi:prepilin-type N-terminal cleavage/methylation domain-containing protein
MFLPLRFHPNPHPRQEGRAFTLIELLVVISIIVILSYLSVISYGRIKANARLSRTSTELASIAAAASQYAQDNTLNYPGATDPSPNDVDRGIPPGLEKYLAGGIWPISAWPKGVFDWDNWPSPIDGTQVHQVTYHLCGLNDPISYCSDPALFPSFTRYSSIFYCIDGTCVPHQNHPYEPAWCVNCKVHKENY